MTVLEIETRITKYLESKNLYFIDMLNTSERLESYDFLINLLKTTKNTYKDKILEFANESENYLNRIKEFIDHCKEMNDEKIDNEIQNEFKSYLFNDRYSDENRIKLVFLSSLTNSSEKSEFALLTIYKELGYSYLEYYIDLLKNPNSLSSYLNDSNRQVIAIHYILFKTNHHSNTILPRNTTTKNLYNMMKNNIDDSIKEITCKKDDFINFMNNEKDLFNVWKKEAYEEKNNLENNYDVFLENCKERISNLENLYNKKLKVEKPAEFMLTKSKEYATSAKHWTIASTILVFILLLILGLIISPEIQMGKKIIEISLFSAQIPIYQSIILLAMVCLIIYVLRVFIKLTISSKHLSEEYKQKYILTYFYLSLISEGKINNELSDSILTKLFTKSDTGLIKNEANIEIESIYKTLTGINK